MPKKPASDIPRPIIILGTGRSFTSVISCMIGEHPDMIGLPETNIFCDATLGEVYDRFSRRSNMFRRAGLMRTLAQFHDGAQTDETIDAAEQFVLERRHWSATEIAAHIAKLAAPRGIVEKSISTCRRPETLARAYEAWPDALFIHTTRQPESIVHSMQSRIDSAREQGKGGKRVEQQLAAQGLEEYFTRLTSTVLEFMATLPPGRGMNLNGENFLNDARPYCRQICEWAGLDGSDASIEAMMHPENNPFAHRGPEKAVGGMSRSFLDNPTYSGKPVQAAPLSIDVQDAQVDPTLRKMALLGHRLGYN